MTDTPADGSPGEKPPTVDSPALILARAQSGARLDKARIDRNKNTWRDLLVGIPITLAFFGTGVVILINWSDYDPFGGGPKPMHWGWGAASIGFAVMAAIILSVRAASQNAVLEEIETEERVFLRAAELEHAPEVDAPLKVNRTLLQEYHRLSTSQARSAFRLAQWVMVAAALLVLGGATAVVWARNTTTAVTVATLTGLISALGSYISTTLLATYRVSVEQARFYFREPLAGGYLLAAENLAQRLDTGERTAALGRVVDGFIQAAIQVPQAVTPTTDTGQQTNPAQKSEEATPS
ncbi:TRADD-N-associated membrane domain-containing protein [Streptomyces sp. SLBN-31]|uniref:TRADD-N-associated membrane domain-containing protein n=1 Tax=Streptomyces sp. SLBN-31 TaxID=2768444 RepID=UPI0011513B5D|nr:hypothetical protein [Streptomyces sp. SLBN-31]TQJ75445.1 hypothetical protein FBY22_8486 [Streptomyces sp. SLBN-31]